MHVDFGDCFDCAMSRDQYPELVPFRLTRMFVAALGVCGIEGIFRHTCERTMGVFRSHADSIVALLDAFIHDPLIDWFSARPLGNALVSIFNQFSSSIRPGDAGAGDADDGQNIPAEESAGDNASSRARQVVKKVRSKLTGYDLSSPVLPMACVVTGIDAHVRLPWLALMSLLILFARKSMWIS